MPFLKLSWFVLFVMVVGCLVGVPVLGQNATTSLRGTVVDSSGLAVAGAVVRVEDRSRGVRLEQTVSAEGEYSFQQLAPARYVVTVEARGFHAAPVEKNLFVNQPATLELRLAAEGQAVAIDVTASASALNTTDATIGDAVSGAMIEALPIEGRNVPDLLSLQPGVLYLGRHRDDADFDSRSGAVAGARSDQGNVTLDGTDNNNQVQGYAFTGVLRSTLDSVEEFRVVTTGSNADTGRSSGAQIDIVTRSGTNAVHGTVYEYNRNTLTAANDWFNKQGQIVEGLPNRPGKLIRNTFGASMGGPVKRDRLFFFGNYEGQRTAENVQQTSVVPTASFRAGELSYLSGGSAVTLTPGQFAAMDPRCGGMGTCPAGPGVNPGVLALFGQYPLPNGSVAGDGLNTASYTWSAPNPVSLNTGIVRLDAHVSDRHQVFARGVLQDDSAAPAPQFPGQAASSRRRDNTKGVTLGEVWTVTPNLVNNARYGFTRQGYADRGLGQGSYVNWGTGTLSNLTAETRSTEVRVPVQQVLDDVSWTRGRHTVQAGVNYRLVHNARTSDALSYDSAGTIGFDVTGSGFAGTGQSFDPGAFGLPAVDAGFVNSYNFAVANLAGIISQVTNQYNYVISRDGRTGTLAPQGALIGHDFKANEVEYYVQDSWRVSPRLTLTAGVRHSLQQTPYEVHGQQAEVTTDLNQWFRNRVAGAAAGVANQPALSFGPSGQARGLPAYWPMAKADFAPRVSVAFAPDGRTSLRAGFGVFFDHFGQGIVNSFSQYGSYGLQGQKQTPNDALSPDNAPRFTGLHAIPAINGPTPATIQYPFTPSGDPFTTGFATAIGLDDKLRTPYSYAMNVSVQRELPGGFTMELAYVGRMGRHLLQQTDLAAPLDFVDAKSGQDFYGAATVLTEQANAGAKSVAPVAYFEDLFPDAAGMGADGTGRVGASATENIYTNLFQVYPVNASYIQYSLDVLCSPGCGGVRQPGQQGRYYNPQFNSLFSWTSNGTSSYNAAQVVLRHPMSHGLQTDFSYTYSKSLDFGSDTERTCVQCGTNTNSTFSYIVNAFRPAENYGVSDFDTTHLITADWVADLPVGRGRRFAGSAGGWLNEAIGGWQVSGLARWTSGLPFTVMAGNGWEVDWSQESAVVKTGPVKMRKHLVANGTSLSPEVFDDPAGLLSGIGAGGPLRNPLPGEAGSRNVFRGDGYFGVDGGLAKTWAVGRLRGEPQLLRFSWEVFNVTNSVRFDVNPLNSLQNQTTSGQFGVYGATLTQPRVQQFVLRYWF